MNFVSGFVLVSLGLGLFSSSESTTSSYRYKKSTKYKSGSPSRQEVKQYMRQPPVGGPGFGYMPVAPYGPYAPQGFAAGGYMPYGFCGGYNPGLIGRVLGGRGSYGCGPYGY